MPPAVLPVEICTDGIDNDCDGLIDQFDIDCPIAFVSSFAEDANWSDRALVVTGGDCDGLSKADEKCQNAANAVTTGTYANIHAGRTYRAWLSVQGGLVGGCSPTNAVGRFSSRAYYRVDGMKIADGYSGTNKLTTSDPLFDPANLLNPISITENGTNVGGINDVWTGTFVEGTSSGSTCDGWHNQAAFLGVVGSSSATNNNWTNTLALQQCQDGKRLYCFQTN